jgi:mRNA-capping enzyme
MTFLERKDETKHLSGTLLDGEMVIGKDPLTNQKIPRYLVYDIIAIHFDGIDRQVGQKNLNTRMICIELEIEGARNKYILEGKINKANEPFSIRQKKFWDLMATKALLHPQFTQITHCDGLIFQPVDHVSVYVTGNYAISAIVQFPAFCKFPRQFYNTQNFF